MKVYIVMVEEIESQVGANINAVKTTEQAADVLAEDLARVCSGCRAWVIPMEITE